jgi:hypothetical protein
VGALVLPDIHQWTRGANIHKSRKKSTGATTAPTIMARLVRRSNAPTATIGDQYMRKRKITLSTPPAIPLDHSGDGRVRVGPIARRIASDIPDMAIQNIASRRSRMLN